MSKRRENQRGPSDDRKVVLGVAWYQPKDWPRLLELSADREQLEETHAQWLKVANAHLLELLQNGV